MTHEIKIRPEYFEKAKKGRRMNDLISRQAVIELNDPPKMVYRSTQNAVR